MGGAAESAADDSSPGDQSEAAEDAAAPESVGIDTQPGDEGHATGSGSDPDQQ